MADIFEVGELEECEDDNDNDADQSPDVKVVIEESSESQILLNNKSEMTVLEEDDWGEPEISLKPLNLESAELCSKEEITLNPDDLLLPVDKLEKYAESENIFNRQVVARSILETLRLVSSDENDVKRVFLVLTNMWNDYDPTIRTELMLLLPHLVAFCKELDLKCAIMKYLLPGILFYLEDTNSQVRKACHSSILSIVEQRLIDNVVLGDICPLVVQLTDSGQSEELRIENILLMSKLIVLLGAYLAKTLYFERFFDLCEDKSNNIRKACASTFGDICTTVGSEITEEILLPKFCTLCEDIAWCVRKACVENFMPVSCVVSPHTRSRPLANLYMILLSDQSRWVRLTAYQALGPFISTFANPDKTGLIYVNDFITYDQSILKHQEEVSPSQESKESPLVAKCNGDVDYGTMVDNIYRTLFDKCDSSIVPRFGASCASAIPGITCHVGSYCTVIEVNGDSHIKDASQEVCDPPSKRTDICDGNPVMNGDISEEHKIVLNCHMPKTTPAPFPLEPSDTSLVTDVAHTVDNSYENLASDCDQNDTAVKPHASETRSSRNVIDEEVDCDTSAFNHFQYWRSPLPEIDIEDDLSEVTHRFGTSLRLNSDPLQTDQTHPYHKKDKGEPPPFSSGLSPYDQDIVPPELLLHYLNMIDPAWAQTIDAEIARHCAYSLPAVALTLGRKFWPCLKDTFDALSSDLQGFIMMWKVRRTVAFAMHRLAVILGPEITSSDLLPVFARFINDLDEVRIGVLQHLYDFLKVLRPAERKQFLPSLPEFLVPGHEADSHERNWRFRHILAEQLASVADLYDPGEVCEHLVPLTLILIQDKICEVRLAAVRVMATVIRRLSTSPTNKYTKKVMCDLTEKFVHSPKWHHRQLYVYTCQEIIAEESLPPEQFAEEALPQLLYLCWDRVPNVRIAISRCLATVLWPQEVFSGPKSSNRELLLETIHTLQSDTDADVRFYANMVSAHECFCLQNGELQDLKSTGRSPKHC